MRKIFQLIQSDIILYINEKQSIKETAFPLPLYPKITLNYIANTEILAKS